MIALGVKGNHSLQVAIHPSLGDVLKVAVHLFICDDWSQTTDICQQGSLAWAHEAARPYAPYISHETRLWGHIQY